MTRYLLFVLLSYYFIVGRGSVEDACYEKVDNELLHFIKTHQIPKNFSISDPRDNIDDLLNRLNRITSNMRDLKNVTRFQASIEEKVDGIPLQDMKNGIELLQSIMDELKRIDNGNNQYMKECKTAENNFGILKKDLSEIERLGKEVNASHDRVTMKIDEINTKSVATKQLVDNLEIPEAYTCNDKILTSLKSIIRISFQIKDQLKQLKKNIMNKLKNLRDKMRGIEKPNVDVAEAALVMGAPPEKLRSDIEHLKRKIRDLKKKLKKNQNVHQIDWEKIIRKWKEQNKKKDRVKKEYEEIKKIAVHLCEMGVCEISRRSTVKIEI